MTMGGSIWVPGAVVYFPGTYLGGTSKVSKPHWRTIVRVELVRGLAADGSTRWLRIHFRDDDVGTSPYWIRRMDGLLPGEEGYVLPPDEQKAGV